MSSRALRAAAAPCLAAVLATSAIALSAFPAAASAPSVPTAPSVAGSASTTPAADSDGSWDLVYRNDFTSLRDVTRFTSSATANDGLSPTDTGNKLLQKPTVAGDVATVPDAAASDGSALGVFTQQNSFSTSAGTQSGWTSGRMAINGQNQAPPVRVRARIRMTPSIGAKTAVMWWPASGGWPWEVDFAETFGGQSLTDFWGSRQNVSQHWHSDLNGDHAATEQLSHNDEIDATKYHTFDLFILPTHMWVEIDGVKTFETYDQRWIPKGAGFFSIGKALTGSREGVHTNDGVYLDWLEIYKASPMSAAVDVPAGPVGTAPTVTGTLVTGASDTTYHVDYGTTTAYGSSTADVTVPASSAPVPVSVQLSGLSPASTYHYRLVATSAAGTVSSADAVLTTGGVPSATAAVVSMAPAAVTVAGVVSTGGLPTTASVQYAPIGGAMQSTPAVVVPAGAPATVTVPLTGLLPGTAYSFATTVSNAAGTATGPTSTFVAPAAPTLSGPTSVVRASTALTVGTAVAPGNLPTSVHVEYGATTSYGSVTPDVAVPAGTDPAALTLDVPGLTSGQRYHYRVVATNAAGSVTGPDALTGTTGRPVAALDKLSKTAVRPAAVSVKVTGSVRPNSLPTTYVVRYGVASKSARTSTAAVSVGSGLWASTVSRTLTGLKRHTCYKITIEARNTAGTVSTPGATICTG